MAWSFGEVGFGRLGLGDVLTNAPADGLSELGFGFGATEDLCATRPQPVTFVMDDQDADARRETEQGRATQGDGLGGWRGGGEEFGDLMLEPEMEPQAHSSRLAVRVRSCAAGDFHSAFLSRTGELFTCGRGEYGRLGHGNHEDAWKPKLVRALAPTSQQGQISQQGRSGCRLLMVACGEAHTVVAAADGRVFTCGSNRAGALGHGDTLDRLVPEAVPGLNLRAMHGAVS